MKVTRPDLIARTFVQRAQRIAGVAGGRRESAGGLARTEIHARREVVSRAAAQRTSDVSPSLSNGCFPASARFLEVQAAGQDPLQRKFPKIRGTLFGGP